MNTHSPLAYTPWVVMAVVIGFLWVKRETWGRHALLGFGFFLIMLAPFWGLNWGAYMNVTWVLEHLLYIPILGLIGLAVPRWATSRQKSRLIGGLPGSCSS